MSETTNYDITGEEYGYLTVITRAPTPTHLKDYKNSYWECKCCCGNIGIYSRDSLRRGRLSCGCIKKPRKPTVRKKTRKVIDKDVTRVKAIWRGMNYRCYDTEHIEYHNYGAKGIKLCDRWLDFDNFKEDMYESYIEFEKVNGEKSATIDRIDPKGIYELSNCRWATQLEQARNRSNNISVEIEGVTYRTLSEVSEAFEIGYQTILQRYNRGLRGLKLVDRSNLVNPNVIRYTNGRVVYKDIDNNSN